MFIACRASSIAPNDSALMPKHGPTPISAISAPAIAGPTMRAVWTMTELSATALTTRSAPTSSITNAWRAGLSSELTVPRVSTTAQTIHTSTEPWTVSAHSTAAGMAIAACVHISRRRLSMRSASTPPQAPNSSIGRNCSAAVTPTSAPLCVSWTISHISAMFCIQLPDSETICPAK